MKILLSFLLAVSLYGAAPVFTIAGVDKISATQARIQWSTTSTARDQYIEYDIQGVSTPLAYRENTKTVSGTVFGETLTGLLPNTDWYYRVCGVDYASSVSGCSAVQTLFHTLSATTAELLADPTAPDPPTLGAVPTTYARTLVVPSGDCNNVTTGLQARIDDARDDPGSGNILITVPKGETCSGNYETRTRTGGGTGWIVIRSSATDDELPPEGSRMLRDWPDTALATISNNNASSQAMYLGGSRYRFIGIKWTNDALAAAYVTITNVSAGTYTVPSHGFSTGYVVHIYDPSNSANYIRNAKVTVTGTDTFTIAAYSHTSGTISAGARLTGGYAFGQLVNGQYTSSPSEHIFDRCKFVSAGFPYSIGALLIMQGTDMIAANNYFGDHTIWRTFDPVTPYDYSLGSSSTSSSINLAPIDGALIYNNYFAAAGITVFAEAGQSTSPRQDVLFRRNTMKWLKRYLPENPEWTTEGYNAAYTFRQPFELKAMRRMKMVGNDFARAFSYRNLSGSAANMIVLHARAESTIHGSTNGTEDIEVAYNSFHDGPGWVALMAVDDPNVENDLEGAKRLKFHNNLVYNMNGYSSSAMHGSVPMLGLTVTGNGGYQGFKFEHNTIWDTKGPSPYLYVNNYGRGIGVRWRDNLISLNATAPYGGSGVGVVPDFSGSNLYAWIKDSASYPDLTTAAFEFDHNVFVGGAGTGSSADYDGTGVTPTDCAGWLTGASSDNKCRAGTTANNRYDAVKLLDRSSRFNFRLRYDSPYISGAHLSSDGKDIGADLDELDVQMGKVRGAKLVLGSSTVIRYMAPDSEACHTKVASSLSGGTWASDGGGARARSTTVTLNGSDNVYLFCAVEQFTCPTTGGTCSLIANE